MNRIIWERDLRRRQKVEEDWGFGEGVAMLGVWSIVGGGGDGGWWVNLMVA